MSITNVAVSSWIQKTPDVIGGDACIRNTRIAVWMLVDARNLGMSGRKSCKRSLRPAPHPSRP